MKRVLVPIDGSECALRAVEQAITQCARCRNPDDFEIHLVNVQAPFTNDINRFVSRDQTASYHYEESEKALKEASTLLDAAGVAYVAHHEVGKPAEVITDLADSLDCDQIVMGTNGRGAFKEFLVGSITLKVIQLAKIPVLLVK